MEQALANLLRNAAQAARHGPVRLSWFQQDAKAGFEVEDDGPGVPESVRPHLFEPFFTTRKSGQGTGLGLAIVHRIAREHGGSVEVGASEMGGARFRIVLDAPDGDPSKADPSSADSDTAK
jgi:signal transduction histidine kinase